MILGVESSCDDTGLALWDAAEGDFIYEKTSSQVDLHALYGGVVPQLAAREHLRNFPILLENLKRTVELGNISSIAVTCGPGLPGSLAAGIAFARSLGMLLDRPVMGIHHLRGHLLSPFIGKIATGYRFEKITKETGTDYFPHLALLVSGGNTLLAEIDKDFQVKVLAGTVDDAAGEAIDKGAKLLGLRYPGGPEIEHYAQRGDPKRYNFPRAFLGKDELHFSFSGLKTSLRYFLEKLADEALQEQFADICASYQLAVIDVLVKKTEQALEKKNYRSVGISGGVSNNRLLRERISVMGKRFGIPVLLPQAKYTGDNASMIAFAAAVDPQHTLSTIDFKPNWPL